jgi:hypothetical protein
MNEPILSTTERAEPSEKDKACLAAIADASLDYLKLMILRQHVADETAELRQLNAVLAEDQREKGEQLDRYAEIVAELRRQLEEAQSSANAWRKVYGQWSEHPGFKKVADKLVADGCYSSAIMLNEWISSLELAQGDKDRLDWLASQYWKFHEEDSEVVASRTYTLCMPIGVPECPVNLRAAIDSARGAKENSK